MYTVGEWVTSNSDDAYVIAERVTLTQAYTLLNIAPPHLQRFIVDSSGRTIHDQREG
jgi:hypothetical protein